jgi:hypothetical protein
VLETAFYSSLGFWASLFFVNKSTSSFSLEQPFISKAEMGLAHHLQSVELLDTSHH